MNIFVRQANMSDIDAVAKLEKRCFSEPWSEQGFRDVLCREDVIFLTAHVSGEKLFCSDKADQDMQDGHECTDIFNVMELGSELSSQEFAGYICMYTALDEGEITNVAVDEKDRGRGVGQALLEEAFKCAERKGLEKIFLEVRESNVPAIELYKKTGFEKTGIRRGFYRNPTEDALLMMKEL